MPSTSLVAIALAGVPTADAVPTDFVAYRVEYLIENDAPNGHREYVVHTPFNRVRGRLHGPILVPRRDGVNLRLETPPVPGPFGAYPVVDEYRFDRGRIVLVRQHPHSARKYPTPD